MEAVKHLAIDDREIEKENDGKKIWARRHRNVLILLDGNNGMIHIIEFAHIFEFKNYLCILRSEQINRSVYSTGSLFPILSRPIWWKY